ncbi:M3 family metallopeptidase [Thiomicrospira microaerophila]|uniref:M3 family metallopeptidase n=1 Tax=Thiomicrospira microaerophila TaxID=406020 RepID=UPI00200CA128|nr:M3 family metallopeptidase [Thiomicrospira microaerophila]UQB42328.1 M3 family metallopeptidase [Thiomicrospira microaerophila]
MDIAFLKNQLPDFNALDASQIEAVVDDLLASSRGALAEILNCDALPSWYNLVEPLEKIDQQFERVWGPIGHLDSVRNSDDWHTAYDSSMQKVTEYYTELGQNAGLFARFDGLANSEAYQALNLAQKKVVDNALRDFRLSGIDLPSEQQAEFKRISQRLSQLSSQFGNHVLKATQAWSKQITDSARLTGLPESAMGLLAQYAQQKQMEGWRITLDFPSYLAVMTHADDRSLREEVYRAFATRASEQSEFKEFDNSGLIEEIRQLRQQKASLLGFSSYADYSIATKMVETTDQVIGFLRDLAGKAKPQAQSELDSLKAFAAAELGLTDLQPWDITYASEKLKQASLSLSQEQLKPYFPVDHTLSGMFKIVEQLFGVKVAQKTGVSVWHDEVRFYELHNPAGEVIAGFYLDLYARENKRGGAWMDVVQSRWRHPQGDLHLPVAYLVCNFTPPIGDKQACLSHDEVTTLFHEFGHGLHHMLTEMEHLNISGIAGVPWDAVELPSQFMENFCWEREGLDLISAHIETGQTLPDDLFDSLKQSRHFQSAMMLARQLEFSLFDFLLHAEYDATNPEALADLMARVRDEVAVVIPPSYQRFAHSFSHIFAGGYAAGYFSYKWAEVLSADAFSLFEETGVLNQQTGFKFKNTILAAGGSVDPMVLFKAFRGREPQIDALLRHCGISDQPNAA